MVSFLILFNLLVALTQLTTFSFLKHFLYLAFGTQYCPGVLSSPLAVSSLLLCWLLLISYPSMLVWSRAGSLKSSLAVFYPLMILCHLIAFNTIYMLATPRFTFLAQMSILNFRHPAAYLTNPLG